MPTDEEIKEVYKRCERMYAKGENWSIRITADTLDCSIEHVKKVIKGEQ